MTISLNSFGKRYQSPGGDAFWAVRDFDLEIRPGEFVTIVGPSGCGKSTVLNAVAGFVKADEGKIDIEGEVITGPNRDRSLVFQAASLLPWRTVSQNVSYGMELQRNLGRREIAERREWAIDLVGLNAFKDHFPSQLSGGMQQRVNLARALATQPKTLLMDEPFGALDAQTRSMMQENLLELWGEFGTTVLFVTHDIDEAVYLADRVVVMSASPGRLIADIPVPLPRPRPMDIVTEPEFMAIKKRCLELIRQETLRAFEGQNGHDHH